MRTVQPNRSPLTNELLAPGEEVTKVLDYEDVEETAPGPDLEIVQAVAHIPKADAWADVEMQESNSPPGFEPEVSKSEYDVNLVHTDPTGLGSAFPVTGMRKFNQRPPGLASQVTMITLATQGTINFPESCSPGNSV